MGNYYSFSMARYLVFICSVTGLAGESTKRLELAGSRATRDHFMIRDGNMDWYNRAHERLQMLVLQPGASCTVNEIRAAELSRSDGWDRGASDFACTSNGRNSTLCSSTAKSRKSSSRQIPILTCDSNKAALYEEAVDVKTSSSSSDPTTQGALATATALCKLFILYACLMFLSAEFRGWPEILLAEVCAYIVLSQAQNYWWAGPYNKADLLRNICIYSCQIGTLNAVDHI